MGDFIQVGFVKQDEVIMNLEFINTHLNNYLPEVYLFSKLRLYAQSKGGSYKGFKFTKNELYNILPKLSELGWINTRSNNITKYRNIVKDLGVKSNVSFSLNDDHTMNIKVFKAYMLAVNESYLLGVKDMKNNMLNPKGFDKRPTTPSGWHKISKPLRTLMKVEKVSQNGLKRLRGRVFNQELSSIMGISISTIGRWRSESRDCGFNSYTLNTVSLTTKTLGRPKNTEFSYRLHTGSFFSPKCEAGRKFTRDLVITSDISIFRTKERYRHAA